MVINCLVMCMFTVQEGWRGRHRQAYGCVQQMCAVCVCVSLTFRACTSVIQSVGTVWCVEEYGPDSRVSPIQCSQEVNGSNREGWRKWCQ